MGDIFSRYYVLVGVFNCATEIACVIEKPHVGHVNTPACTVIHIEISPESFLCSRVKTLYKKSVFYNPCHWVLALGVHYVVQAVTPHNAGLLANIAVIAKCALAWTIVS
jgi:hypothetical protein